MPSKMKDYQGMSDEQLSLTLKDTEKHLFQLRFQSATDRLETPSEIRKARKEIARLRTIQRLRELDELRKMPAEQLAPKIQALETKDAEGGPGKRTARRKLRRLQTFHAAKTQPQPAGAHKGAK
ncbi:MAG: ribosomal protein [Gemmataceae bacterium]|nr:ribosomal protein [Gemmataceae bacterium]